MKTIKINSDFSEFPGLRHCSISDKSGEEFYHLILNEKFYEAKKAGEKLIVDLDHTDGYASSFLDEAFGNLVFDFTLKEVKDSVEIISNQEPHWKKMILEKSFHQWENRRIKEQNPIVTKIHEPWYRNVDGKITKEIWESPAKT